MRHRNWFWGIFFLAAAIFVIASQTGAFGQIGFWSICATVLFVAVFISSLIDLNFFGLFLSLALLYSIYQQPLHLLAIDFWLLIFAAVLASSGCSMIFHGHYHHYWSRGYCGEDSFQSSEETIEGNDIVVKSSFCESCKYLHSDSLKSARLSSSFGKLSIYFDQVRLSPDGAEAHIDSNFGEMVLYVPKTWRIVDHVRAGFGAVNSDRRGAPADENSPALTLTGSVSFGNLSIRYT